jgi:hypothetical protein
MPIMITISHAMCPGSTSMPVGGDDEYHAAIDLPEARAFVAETFESLSGSDAWAKRNGLIEHVQDGVAEIIAEQGGVVQGLRDGTEIHVRPINECELRKLIPSAALPTEASKSEAQYLAELCEVFNAEQGTS